MYEPTPSRPVRFVHRGAMVEVANAAPTRTVLEWLREDARCTGTKEGCNEGDCGACTVVIGEPADPGDPFAVRGLSLKPVNACIRFLPTLDGKALFTVEDLKALQAASPGAASDTLHPVQRAMVDSHGSQCGFCTPGFVMSLWSTYERHRARSTLPGRQQLADDLAGNLCRCTGYRPILDAGEAMFALPPVALDTTPLLTLLDGLASDHATFVYAPSGTSDRFFAPRTLDHLATLRQNRPDAQLLAGATDVGLWVNKQFRPLGDIVYLGAVAELRRIETRDTELRIGAGASLEAAWSALAQQVPALTEVWKRFASPPIRHAGTMGGNLANGSPIGDAAPVLMALDAEIELRLGARIRRLPLHEFYLGYMKNRLEPGEFVQAIVVPLAATSRTARAYKNSKRFDSDISAVCAGFSIALDDAGKVAGVRLAFGGMAAVVKRAAAAEAALLGRPWDDASKAAAQAALTHDFQPLTDMRASAAYRLRVARNLLHRFWLETRAENPLPVEQTQVFSGMTRPVGST